MEEEREAIGRATYSPEDNKLRIYPDGVRVDSVLDEGEYAAFKAAGFKWAGKQECFVSPRWTPSAEDWALKLCGEIEDEDYSALERSADRAERFGDYRDKRAGEAGAAADAFSAGPSAFGNQSRARAERQARRHDRYRVGAVSQWSKAEYWQQRTAGVISHALHRADPRVRRGRIKTLEADQRKHLKSLEECQKRYDGWRRVRDTFEQEPESAARLARALANYGICWDYEHPRTGKNASLYCHLEDAADPINAGEAAALYLASVCDPSAPGKSWNRWTAHYDLRLTYERAMLENEGGTAAAVEIEPGGWFGRLQVQKVNRSTATGLVVSVGVIGPHPWRRDAEGNPVIGVQSVNIERLPADAYRAPTDDERAAFVVKKAADKASREPCPTINPTREAADKLQAAWNAAAAEKRPDAKPSVVEEMTQKEFSGRLKHDCTAIVDIDAAGRTVEKGGAFKVRIMRRYWSSARSVVVLTDKPQKPLPAVESLALVDA